MNCVIATDLALVGASGSERQTAAGLRGLSRVMPWAFRRWSGDDLLRRRDRPSRDAASHIFTPIWASRKVLLLGGGLFGPKESFGIGELFMDTEMSARAGM